MILVLQSSSNEYGNLVFKISEEGEWRFCQKYLVKNLLKFHRSEFLTNGWICLRGGGVYAF